MKGITHRRVFAPWKGTLKGVALRRVFVALRTPKGALWKGMPEGTELSVLERIA
jgi:hypothetical protein